MTRCSNILASGIRSEDFLSIFWCLCHNTGLSNEFEFDKPGAIHQYRAPPEDVMAKVKKLPKKELKRFRGILEQRRTQLMELVEATREQGIGFAREDLPDEVDLATTESGRAMNLMLRDRERVLLRKIDKALAKIDAGEYGLCENCGDPIEVKRLEARPVTDMCILCKEEQEQMERSYAE